MKRDIRSLWMTAFAWLFGFAAYMPVCYLVEHVIYPALYEWFPSVFPRYNFVNESAEYERWYSNILLISAFLAILLIRYIVVRFDNGRLEYMIDETDGMYTVREGCVRYFTRYLRVDALISLVVPLPLPIIRIFIPDELPKLLRSVLDPLFSMTDMFTERFGLVLGIAVMALALFIAGIPAALISIANWRGAWLSDIGEVS